MANNHVYGFRWHRSIHGGDTPQILTFPIATGYAPVTVFGAGTSVNINPGDPVRLLEDGTVALTQTAQDVTGQDDDSDDFAFGIVVGFPRVLVGGFARPNGFYTSGTAYTGGIGSDSATLCAVIPVAGNIFEIDMDAAPTVQTLSGALANVGGVATMAYSVLTSGTGQPKANPLLSKSSIVFATANQLQLLIVGLGKRGYTQDFTAANVTYQVMWNTQQLAVPTADMTATAIAGVYGANLE
jgi:hypothetical protein